MTSPRNQPPNDYIIDVESAVEMARLLDQDQILTQEMGGIFPERVDLSGIIDVLDLACGPGGWVHDVAHTYPQMRITGVDISQRMITYARAHAHVRKLSNAHFRIMDVLKPLAFPAASFDLVNARTIVGFMRPDDWPRLIQECKRILRPGGILRMVEGEAGPKSKLAIDKFFDLINKAFMLSGRSFSPTGRFLGVHPYMIPMLRAAGFQDIQKKAAISDHSYGMPAYEPMRQDVMIMLKLIQPFLVRAQVISQEEVEVLCEQAMEEITSEDYYAISYLLTVWGRKPAMP